MTTDRTGAIAVTERLDELERHNRRLWLGLITVALGVSALFLAAAMLSTTQTVTAQKFVLVDASGKVRAFLDVDKHGRPGFGLLDASGNQRAILSVGTDGEPGFGLYDASGKGGAFLSLVKDSPNFSLSDASGNPRAVLALVKDGRPNFHFTDASGNLRAILNVRKDGEPSFQLYDASASRLVLGSVELTSPTRGGTEVTPVASITAFDKNGNVIGRWPQ